MNYFFVDAETDGLYGDIIAVGVVVINEKGIEIDRFGGKIKGLSTEMIKDEWVKENVLPFLDNSLSDFQDLNLLLDEFWLFWMKHRETSICIADVQYPVEAGLFRKCVEKDLKARIFQGPFPLLDLSTLLFAKGIDPLTDRFKLCGIQEKQELRQHNPIEDAKLVSILWRKYYE
jgi:hypothetical protein